MQCYISIGNAGTLVFFQPPGFNQELCYKSLLKHDKNILKEE